MNLIFYQKVDSNDPLSYRASGKNAVYANHRRLRFFEYCGANIFVKVLNAMTENDECEGAVVLAEHERLTVDGLERMLDGCSYLASVISGRRTLGKRGFYFFRKDEEGLAKLEEFASSMKSGVPTKGNEDGNSYVNESDQRERRRPRRVGSALPRDCEISASVGRSVISNDNGNSYGNESDHRERCGNIRAGARDVCGDVAVARERVSPAPGSAPPESKETKKTKTTKSKKKQKTE